MAFNYTALFTGENCYESGVGYWYRNRRLLFIREDGAGGWESVVVDNDFDDTTSGLGSYYAYAQNIGSTFLIFLEDQRLYRSEDEGDTWERIDDAPDDFMWLEAYEGTYIAMAYNNPNALFYQSEDYGDTWTQVGEGKSWMRYMAYPQSQVCMDENGVIHMVGEEGSYLTYSRSEDLGETWADTIQISFETSNGGETVEFSYLHGVAARNEHVCIACSYDNSTRYKRDTAYVIVSHDNGDTWEDATLQNAYVADGWCGFTLDEPGGILMDDDYVAVLMCGYMNYYGDTCEGDYSPPPDPFNCYWYTTEIMRFTYDQAGAAQYSDTQLITASEGGFEDLVIGNTTFGQEKPLAVGLDGLVPVDDEDISNPDDTWWTRTPDPDYTANYWYNPLRTIDMDGNLEEIWEGNYPGPSPYNAPNCGSDSWDYRDKSNQCYRMSSWRTAPGHLYVDNCQLGDRAGAGALYSVGCQMGDRASAGALYAVGCELGERNVE